MSRFFRGRPPGKVARVLRPRITGWPRTGAAVKTLREKKGLTQRQLADRIAVSDKAVSKCTWAMKEI